MESPPPLITIDQSFTFIINCTAMGVPTPQVVWRLNWGHVPDKCSQSNTLLEENRSYGELSCPQASELDQGAYSCEAISSMVRGKMCDISSKEWISSPHQVLFSRAHALPVPLGVVSRARTPF